jgi:hypothetical protein
MDLRWITFENVLVLQKYVYTGTILVGEELVPQYEWQTVPTV